MPSSTRKPSLATKKTPAQQRGTDTYELILETAAQLLVDVGVERLSTNMVCERAGVTPPALYRYFPNKYALLCELGQRLMLRQNELVPRWITPQALQGSAAQLEQALVGLLLDTYRVTRETTGGVWILRALRAVPTLQKVRLESHAQVAAAQNALMRQSFPAAKPETLELVERITVDLIYAGVELLFDEPLDPQAVAQVIASMIASYLGRLER